jgi:hypothetical protein
MTDRSFELHARRSARHHSTRCQCDMLGSLHAWESRVPAGLLKPFMYIVTPQRTVSFTVYGTQLHSRRLSLKHTVK